MLTRKQKWRKCRSYEMLKKHNLQDENISIPISDNDKYKKNYIKFADIVKVILIPTREEYIINSLDNNLWYTQEDYIIFKSNYLDDVRKSKYNTI